jgi:hypothetical protein
MATKTKNETVIDDATIAPDTFVPDSKVRQELNASAMSLWRWDRDPAMIALGWPPPIKLGAGKRKHRSRRQLELLKKNLMLKAIADRGGKAA